MDKYYIGYDEQNRPEVFACDDPKYATPEASGYTSVEGPFDTLEEAKEAAGLN
jgi:hypothetical protein